MRASFLKVCHAAVTIRLQSHQRGFNGTCLLTLLPVIVVGTVSGSLHALYGINLTHSFYSMAEDLKKLRDSADGLLEKILYEDDDGSNELPKLIEGQKLWFQEQEAGLFADTADVENNPDLAALQALAYDDPPEILAENLKERANKLLAKGPKFYRQSLDLYTEAIDAQSPNAKKNSIYYSNRAHVQLLLGSSFFSHSLLLCLWAESYRVTLFCLLFFWRSHAWPHRELRTCSQGRGAGSDSDPQNIKAYFRAARGRAAAQVDECRSGRSAVWLIDQRAAAQGRDAQVAP